MPSSDRAVGRPVSNRTRTFRPNYLSFAGTYQCNLTCAHCCVPIEWTDRLDIPTALGFLEDAYRAGIRLLGFTGGEPFLYPEFVIAITRRAAELGFRFDKIVTNGVWFRDQAHLRSTLTDLKNAGFTGKLGLGVDKFHGIRTADLIAFCRIAREVFQRDNILSLAYASRDPHAGLEPVHMLAKALDAVVEWSDMLGRYLLVSLDLTMTLNWNHLAPVERAEKLDGAWDGVWFEEDYCEGPGQALIVNPRGDVKPCCGFASDLDQLTIGNVYRDTVEEIIVNGREHPFVGTVFRDGLTAIRDDVLARDSAALPGATSNHCFFCWYVLAKNLTTLSPARAENARISLPLAGASLTAPVPKAGQVVSTMLMVFDGKRVVVARDLPPRESQDRGTIFLLNIAGPATVEPAEQPMAWGEYQAWVDGLRGAGYTLTTHNFAPCQK